MPAGFLQSGDFYFVDAESVAETTTQGVEAAKTFTTAGPVSLALPAPWTYAGPVPAALPTFSVAYSGFSGTVYNDLSLSWPLGGTNQSFYMLTASSSYLGGSTSVTFPDLGSLPGFVPPAASGSDVSWVADIIEGPYPATDPASGTVSTVFNSGNYIVP